MTERKYFPLGFNIVWKVSILTSSFTFMTFKIESKKAIIIPHTHKSSTERARHFTIPNVFLFFILFFEFEKLVYWILWAKTEQYFHPVLSLELVYLLISCYMQKKITNLFNLEIRLILILLQNLIFVALFKWSWIGGTGLLFGIMSLKNMQCNAKGITLSLACKLIFKYEILSNMNIRRQTKKVYTNCNNKYTRNRIKTLK